MSKTALTKIEENNRLYFVCICSCESTPKTPKIKKISFDDLFTFFNLLILKHQRISKNENLLQNNSFLKIVCFRSGLNCDFVVVWGTEIGKNN